MGYGELIRNVLGEMEGHEAGFRPDELAYLALTSKPELAVRDRLAYRLYKKLKQDGSLVAREYYLRNGKRADIAILNGKDSGRPAKVLIELTAYSFFNLDHEVHPKMQKTITEKVKADFDKCRKDANEVFCLFLAPSIENECLPDHDHPLFEVFEALITSWGSWSSYKKNEKRQDKKSVKKEMSELFEERKWDVISHDEITSGSAFALQVSIPYWLLKPSSLSRRTE